jgi:hypothetical protein
MGDEACPSSVPAPGGGGDDPHGLAVELEIDLRLRQQAGPLADVGGREWSLGPWM